MSQIFQIERNIPVSPSIRGGAMRPSPFPVVQLSPGDSFFVPDGVLKGKDNKPLSAKQAASRINGACGNVKRKYNDRSFATRRVEGGVRCWRLT